MEIRRVATRSDAFAAQALFHGRARPDATARFLAESGHHMLVAYVDGAPAGMVSGIETTHPDRGTEMLLYELNVAEEQRNHGIGTELVRALGAMARECGCYGMRVLAERTNTAAMTAYTRAGGSGSAPTTVFTWSFDESAAGL